MSVTTSRNNEEDEPFSCNYPALLDCFSQSIGESWRNVAIIFLWSLLAVDGT